MISSRERLVAIAWMVGVAAVAVLPNPAAVIPSATYYFRDLTLTFYPLRYFQATELAAGRLPFWNPYVHEGEFMLPSLYPLEFLHILNPSPEFVSWLLTLHLPLAALGAYALGRSRGMPRLAAFATGAVYSIGGFSLSTLNLYIFLQALAIAPFLLLTIDYATGRGGRWIVACALVLATALSTLAVEFIAQILLVGLCLAWARDASSSARLAKLTQAGGRFAALVGLGVGLASIPIAITLGVLPETVRGDGGFDTGEAGGLSIPPLMLLQSVIPSLYTSFAHPFEAWWGVGIFPGGPPYFMSIYVGVLVLSIAAAGVLTGPFQGRITLLALAAAGTLYALGPYGGLWTLLHDLPFASAFRAPAKSFLTAHLALALLAGYGIQQLGSIKAWRWVAVWSAAGTLVVAGIAVIAWSASDSVSQWLQLDPRAQHEFVNVFPREALLSALIAMLGCGLAMAAARKRVGRRLATTILVVLVVFDLARAGIGVNQQAPSLYFQLLPEIAAEKFDQLDGGRVFAMPASGSHNYRSWLEARIPNADLWAFYAIRQQLDPYSNLLDRVETAASLDRTRFAPLLTELGWTGNAPQQIERILPFLRHSGVSKIVSFDPLTLPELQLRRVVDVARTGLAIHVYAIRNPWPRTRIACRVRTAASRVEAALAPHGPGFDPLREVVLESASTVQALSCTNGVVHTLSTTANSERYEVESDGAGWLVVRATHARGWKAWIDGRPAPLVRADGRHKAVAISAGRHDVEMRYEPPWLPLGVVLTLVSTLLAFFMLVKGSKRRRADG